MLEIRYSGNETVDLRASKVEFLNLRDSIIGIIESDLREIHFETDEAIDPKPWESVANGLTVFREGDAVYSSITKDGVLRVEGSDENLKSFLSFFPIDESVDAGEHTHFEYYEGNPFIRQDSVPLVISIR